MRCLIRSMLLSVTVLFIASCGSNHLSVSVPSGKRGYNNVLKSVVALVEPTENGMIGPTCSGFFISKKDLITAGHCVLDYTIQVSFGPRGFQIEQVFEEPESAVGKEVHFVTTQQHNRWLGVDSTLRENNPSYMTATVLEVLGPKGADVALLRLKSNQPSSKNWLKTRSWSKNPPRAGEEAFSVGMPVGRLWMLTRGIISRVAVYTDNTVEVYHDARIGPGSSGSPLMDTNGYVVGINTSITQGNILSIATPSSYIDTLYKLLKTKLELQELDRQYEELRNR